MDSVIIIIVELVNIVTMINISTISIRTTQSVMWNRYTKQVSITYVTVFSPIIIIDCIVSCRSSSLIVLYPADHDKTKHNVQR